MLLHFTSTNSKKIPYDRLIETENNSFEGILCRYLENKKLFIINFEFKESNVEEAHEDESLARGSILNKLLQLGYEINYATQLSQTIKFQVAENSRE